MQDKNGHLNTQAFPLLQNHLANQRTFLAWIRTSIGIMAFGFVIERFSLFLKEIAGFIGDNHKSIAVNKNFALPSNAAILGLILVALGTITCLLAFINYKKIERQINFSSYKPAKLLDTLLALMIFFIGVFLTTYLFGHLGI